MFDEVDAYNAEYERAEEMGFICDEAEYLGRSLRDRGFHWSEAQARYQIAFPDFHDPKTAPWQAFRDGFHTD